MVNQRGTVLGLFLVLVTVGFLVLFLGIYLWISTVALFPELSWEPAVVEEIHILDPLDKEEVFS